MEPKLTLTLLLALLTGPGVSAQDPQPYFERITTQDGLSHNKVNCIIQDQRGFIWLGTDDGLNRFDGERFVTFRNSPGNMETISGNIITDLLEDDSGRIWIATADGGLSRYNYRLAPEKQFKQYRHAPEDPASIPVNIINALVEDKLGYLWLASAGHSVLRFDKENERFEEPVPEGTRTALALCLDKDGIIWVGRQGGGLLKINPYDLSYEQDPRYSDLYARFPHAAVTALMMDSRENIWFGSWDNVLYRYDARSGTEEVFQKSDSPYSFANDQITSFAEDSLGRIWMGGNKKGLHILDKKTGRFYNYRYDPSREGTIADDHINCVYIDRNGNTWIGTDKGVCVNNPFKQQFSQTFLRRKNPDGPMTIYGFYEAGNHDLWIGTSEGLYIRRQSNGSIIHRPLSFEGKQLHVTSFFRDENGKVYLGTDYSLFSYDPAGNKLRLLPEKQPRDLVMNPLIDSRVVSILKDTIEGNPVLLVSPYGHFLTYYDLKEKRWISRLDGEEDIIRRFNISDNLIRKFIKTSDGTIWLATVKYGLGIWPRNPFAPIRYFSNKPGDLASLSNNNIYDIIEDSKNNLWLSTYGGGLHYFNTSTRQFFQIASSNNLTEGLAIDGKGNIWMISNGHLQNYDPETEVFTNYSLPDAERSGGVKGYIFKDSSGRLYLAGNGYFIDFHPDSISNVRFSPKVLLTGFSIFNQPYSHLLMEEEIRLGHNDNYFTIGFAAPCFTYGGKLNYAYQLEGFDQKWIASGSRREVSYSNLDGGIYTFRVKAGRTPGLWNEEFASVRIIIIPPFWERNWFYLACMILIAAVIYAIYRYRIAELLKRQDIRNRIAQDLHDNVGSTLSSISVYSQVAKIYHGKRQMDDLYGTLEKISDASGEMISEMNDTVWAINPRNDQMSVILQRMEAFARSLLTGQTTAFEFHYDTSVTDINLDMEKRKNFYLIFKEAVNNAVKYSGCELLRVTLRQEGRQLHMRIEDDGKGFDHCKVSKEYYRPSGGGNGLRNMQVRAKEMHGQLKIITEPGRGTTVELVL